MTYAKTAPKTPGGKGGRTPDIQYIMVYLERATAHPLPHFTILEYDEYPSRKTAETGTTGSASDLVTENIFLKVKGL